MFRSLISLVLIFQLALPGMGSFSLAQDTPHSPAGEPVSGSEPGDSKPDPKVGLDEAFFGEASKRHPLDTFGLLIQEVHPSKEPLTEEDLYLVARKSAGKLGSSGEPLQVRLHDLGAQHDSARKKLKLGEGEFFHLALSARGEIVHHFSPELSDVIRIGKYLVFIEKGAETRRAVKLELESEEAVQARVLNLSFIDLEYFQPALGKTALPIFRLPVVVNEASGAPLLGVSGDVIEVGGQRVPVAALDLSAKIHSLAFNLTVSLTDPKSLERVGPVVDSFWEEFTNSMGEWEKDSFEQIQGVADLEGLKSHLKTALHKRAKSEKPVFDQEPEFARLADLAGKQLERSRKLTARAQLLFHQLTFPQQLGAPTLIAALGHLAAAVSIHPEHSRRWHLREAFAQVWSSKVGRFGALASAALVTAQVFPESAVAATQGAVEVGQSVVCTALNLCTLIGDAAKATFQGFNPIVFGERYLNSDTLIRLGVGTMAVAGYAASALGIPHLLVNTTLLFRDMRTLAKDRPELGLLKRFVERERRSEARYVDALSNEQAELDGEEKVEFTPEDDREMDRLLEEMGANNGKKREILRRVANSLPMRVLKSPWTLLTKTWDVVEPTQVGQLLWAVRHFFISYASFTNSGYAYTTLWNWWFSFRSFLFNVPSWMYFLSHPDFYGRAISNVKADGLSADERMKQLTVTFPTEANGVRRSAFGGWVGRVSKWAKLLTQNGRHQLEMLRAWEAKIIPVERAIQSESIRAAFEAVLSELNPAEFESLSRVGPPTSFSDARVREFPFRVRTLFRAYFEEFYQAALGEFLKNIIADSPTSSLNGTETIRELKSASLSLVDGLVIEPKVARKLVDQVADDSRVVESARERAQSFFSRQDLNLRHNILTKMDPTRNRQILRIERANNAIESPKAMARAVRAMISGIVVDKPMEYIATLVCFATATTGLLMTVHPEMHSDTAFFHMSKYLFGTSFLVGMVVDVLATTWMKLQMFAAHAPSKFNNVPEGKDAELSYWGWWRKQVWKNPENSWLKNQKEYWAIITSNFRASFVLTLATNFATLGRFDLDLFILGWTAAYALPFSGMQFQYENGLELASGGYDARNVPVRLRSHPKFQKFVTSINQRRRSVFSFWYKAFENLTGYFVSNLMLMNSAQFGTRALGRIMFAGYTPTELASLGLRSLKDGLGAIPGVAWLMGGCETLLTRNYEAWSKVSKPPK